jgi:hypothetical protein
MGTGEGARYILVWLAWFLSFERASAASLTWNAGADTNVVGYLVYWGATSQSYTQSVDVGNVTSAPISTLSRGPTNYFAVTAYNNDGVESDFSNEAVFIDGGQLMAGGISANQPQLFVTLFGGYLYDVQFSASLTNWTTIASVLARTNGIYEVMDTNFMSGENRFYRLILR